MTSKNFQLLQFKYSKKSKELDKKLLKMPINENHEELIYLPPLFKKNNVHILLNKNSGESFYLRKSVAVLLIKAARYFDRLGYTLKLESSFRSLKDQKERFIKRYAEMEKTFPNKGKEELLKLTNIYTAGIPILAAHTAGAGVDVILLNKLSKTLDFGCPYKHGDIESVSSYANISRRAKENRKILKKGMEKFGFVNYPFEYWHFSIGDVCAAFLTRQKCAKFGPIEYDYKKEKIIQPKSKMDLYNFFLFKKCLEKFSKMIM